MGGQQHFLGECSQLRPLNSTAPVARVGSGRVEPFSFSRTCYCPFSSPFPPTFESLKEISRKKGGGGGEGKGRRQKREVKWSSNTDVRSKEPGKKGANIKKVSRQSLIDKKLQKKDGQRREEGRGQVQAQGRRRHLGHG